MKITALYRYPVKSCRGSPVTAMDLGRRGPVRDRRWMIVDADGRFLTQREEPRMALVDVALVEQKLVLSVGERASLALPVELHAGERREVEIWRDRVEAIEHEQGGRWMSDFLGREVRLVYMPDDVERRVNPIHARPADIVSFADGYPLLVISEESLVDLNSRLETPLEAARFRPNVVVAGGEPYVEDTFARVRMGDVSFRGPKRCDRCTITTVDLGTGERGTEPLATLATYRREGSALFFGMNLIHDTPGTLRIGDAVSVS